VVSGRRCPAGLRVRASRQAGGCVDFAAASRYLSDATEGGGMILGQERFFTRQHYEAHRGLAPAHLSELVVHCLELVSQLVHQGLELRFKGGNSLLVLLEDPQRFSVDVDIVTTESKQRLTEAVQAIVEGCDVFTRFEARAPRTKPWLPMISFKLFFDSVYQKPEDAFVMLDCVLEAPAYEGVRRRVRCLGLYESELMVELPSVSGLKGDKLLCIGPATLGIPLGRSKEAHRLKHVFDVALLARQPHELGAVLQSVLSCMEQENRIQGSSHSFEAVVEDTVRFLREPLGHAHPPELEALEPATYLYEIVKGFDQFREHLFRTDYTWQRLRGDCEAVLGVIERLQGLRPQA
jgi:hypothetical protein